MPEFWRKSCRALVGLPRFLMSLEGSQSLQRCGFLKFEFVRQPTGRTTRNFAPCCDPAERFAAQANEGSLIEDLGNACFVPQKWFRCCLDTLAAKNLLEAETASMSWKDSLGKRLPRCEF